MQTVIHYADLLVDTLTRQVLKAGRATALTDTEYRLLLFLLTHQGVVCRRDDIIDGVWGERFLYDTGTLDVHLSSLRHKLGWTKRGPVRSVRGVGLILPHQAPASEVVRIKTQSFAIPLRLFEKGKQQIAMNTTHHFLGTLAMLLLSPCCLAESETDTLTVRDMDEVVVVSTAKEHSLLRSLPLSSTSLGQAQLQAKGIDGIKGLSAHIPGLFIPSYGSRLTSSIYLRGVGSRIGTPAIGMYVDDIPLANMSSIDQDLSDADRIDVLRGPQGTLYGRNTIGGLIRVYTKNPMSYQGTDLMLGAATYNNIRARVTHYHHPVENLAFSAGVSCEHLGGFHKNHFLGQRADESDDIAAHWRGIYRPSERVSLDLTARYQWTRQGAYPYAATVGDDAGRVAYNRKSSYLRHNLSTGLKAEHDLNRVLFSSITGFQFLGDDMFMDQDFTRKDLFSLRQRQNSKVLSEEIAIRSKDTGRWQWASGVNVQYQWLRTEAPVTFYREGVEWLSSTINGSLPDLTPVSPSLGRMSIDLRSEQLSMGGTFHTPTLTTGLFHQSTVGLVKRLSLTVGVRLEYEHYRMSYDAPGNMDFDFAMQSSNPRNNIVLTGLNAAPALRGKTGDDHLHVLPKAALKYDFGQTGCIYASASRGYRSGGYNVQLFSDLLQTELRREMMSAIDAGTEDYLNRLFGNNPYVPDGHAEMITGLIRGGMPDVESPDVAKETFYKPETSWNYELGTHLNLLEGRVKADLAAFWIETSDLLISQMAESGLGRATINAGKSRSRGLEATVQAAATDALMLSASYGFTHAIATLEDADGTEHRVRVPFAPRHTMSAGAEYTWHTRGWMHDITLGATGRGNGRICWTRENDLSQPFYALLDARLSVRHDDLEISLWGNNLTATRYDAFSFFTRGQAFSQRGTPLQAGLDMRLRL